MSVATYGWLVIACPLAGSIVIALGWRVWSGRTAGWIGSAAIFLAFLNAIGALVQLQDKPAAERHVTSSLWDYVGTSGVDARLEILVDPLAVLMALVVSGVSFLIHVYSVAYMAGDRGYARYFSYLNFFVFSMLLLVLAGNFFFLIVGWAFVGFASYALISYWYRRQTATAAGMKAFVINVIGDVGLVLAAIILLRDTGHLDFARVFESAPEAYTQNEWTIVAVCLLIMVGAFAKSAQIPLHTWLADAMEGPTPVSALIHAATMVTAGVYLIARCYPLFELAPTAADISAAIGALTLVFAASVALVVTDLKRIIAYSTISQIGYMIMGVSIAAYGAGMFHLMTHAFFKALMFMAAGSVIAAMAGNQNIDRMSGLRRAMPFTYVAFLVAALALAAFPGFSGYFSKDEILAFAAERGGGYWILYVAGTVAAVMTAFYAFRMVFRVFWGEPSEEARELERGHLHHAEPMNPVTGEPEDIDVGYPGPEHHIAEREGPMRGAMVLLAILAITAGVVQIPGVTHVIENFLEPTFEDSRFAHTDVSGGIEALALSVGALSAIAGIGLAWLLYVRQPGTTLRLAERFRGLHDFLEHKWYFDELYDRAIVRPTLALGAWSANVFERYVVSGMVSGTALVVRAGNQFVRVAQSGVLRYYALLLMTGVTALALYFLVVSR
ncbi:MAG TPA: NADH-quinone oxidoreductase subunit L [Solirubrobacterales bacterium]|nr:NADH-quinone oxidoreductase subunit L [Solirubrobacterales bacterium]